MGVEVFHESEAALEYRAPSAHDHKYSRGVVGLATGSTAYPGAALLGVDGALSTGIGMVRYVGPDEATRPLLVRRPEAVLGAGPVSAWVVGSGMSDTDTESMNRARRAMDEGKPTVVDAGALSLLPHTGLVLATPHAGEMAKVFGVSRESVEGAPAEYALLAASQWNATVLLKGSTTFIANQFGDEFSVSLATPWLAIAGAGDVLGGVLGSMIATRATDIAADQRVLARIAASAVVIHSLAAHAASAGGPFLLDQLVMQIPVVIRKLLAR
jgi:NAD(P)H-hydrate repair Nnr-like enzyme with NAD(P)H-hydrate dehydratase domain